MSPTGDLSTLARAFETDKEGEHHYAEHYEHHFHHLRHEKLNILEIGIGGYGDPRAGGASLKMWKEYFPKSSIFGIDIFDKSFLNNCRIKTFQGSQADEVFLKKVAEEIGPIDIIIDDGSHVSADVIAAFKVLFPLMAPHGIYAVEDMQTSYWEHVAGQDWGGSRDLAAPHTSMNFFKRLLDGLNHAEFTLDEYEASYFDRHIVSMHFYHNLVFICKGLNNEGSNVLGHRERSSGGVKPVTGGPVSLNGHVDTSCRWLNIEMSSICNLRCRWCILDHHKPKTFLPLEKLEHILKEIVEGQMADLERIDLHNGGETLLHPQIDEALNLLAGYRKKFPRPISIALLTNGTVIKESTLQLLTSGDTVDEIRVSVDGGTAEQFEFIRTNAHWEKVSANVKRISGALKSSGSATKLGIICMVAPDKPLETGWMEPDFQAVLRLADHLEIRHPHTWEGTLGDVDGLKPDVTHKQKDRLCKFLKSNLVVLASGDVSVCCADLNGRGIVGTAATQSLSEIVAGPQRQQMIDLWRQGRFEEIPLCSTCEGYYDGAASAEQEKTPAPSTGNEEALQGMSIAQLEKLVAADGGNAATHNLLGVLYCKEKYHTKGLAHFKRAVALDEAYVVARKNLANVQEVLGKFDEAAYSYQCVINEEPDDCDALCGLGRLSLEAQRFEGARHFFGRVLASDPDHAEARQVMETLQQWEGKGLIPKSSGQDVMSSHLKSGPVPVLPVSRFTSLREYERHSSAMRTEVVQRDLKLGKLVPEGADTFTVPGFCYVCRRHVDFRVDFLYGGTSHGVRMPNWRERLVCPGCNLNNRVRASIQFFEQILVPAKNSSIYITEQCTPVYNWLRARYRHTVGSEYLGGSVPFGSTDGVGIRNESLTRLTFSDAAFDFILCFEVFEHIPEYQRAFAECRRILKDGGRMLFTVPFVKNSQPNITRAVVQPDGTVEHHLPPEYHGDPVKKEGCLAFYHFGWDMLKQVQEAGFDDVALYTVWSDALGYLGDEQLLFVARARPASPRATGTNTPTVEAAAPPRMFCAAPWAEGVLQMNGDFRTCCRNGTSFGNWKEHDAEYTWRSREFQDFRSKIAEGVFPDESCQRCYANGTSRSLSSELLEPFNHHIAQLVKAGVPVPPAITSLKSLMGMKAVNAQVNVTLTGYFAALDSFGVPSSDEARTALMKLSVIGKIVSSFLHHETRPEIVAPHRQVQLQSKCNARCIQCPGLYTGEIIHGPSFDENLIDTALAPTNNVMSFFMNGSEFLLFKHWKRVAELLVSNGVKLCLSTNGILLKPATVRYLVDTKALQSLNVSLDGATPATVEAIRVNAKFDDLIQNLAFVFLYAQEKAFNFSLSISFVLMKRNFREFPLLVRLIDRIRGKSQLPSVNVYCQALETYRNDAYQQFVHQEHHSLIDRSELVAVFEDVARVSRETGIPVGAFYSHTMEDFLAKGCPFPPLS